MWNRVRMMKDPDTGRWISRANPREDWKRIEVPRLAIIEKELFDAAQRRKADRSHEAPERQRRAKFLLSGLLKSGCLRCRPLDERWRPRPGPDPLLGDARSRDLHEPQDLLHG